MKAYRVHDGEPAEGCLLVFAPNINRAKTLAFAVGWMPEWTMIRVQRKPVWDEYATAEKVIERNEDLPASAPTFYVPYCAGADWSA